MTVASIVAALRGRAPERSNLGNTIHRANADSERYAVDFAPDFTSEGWEQFDTDQDAHYFGVWVNPAKRLTLCYAEGDWMLVGCETDADYNREIAGLIEFHGEGRIALVIDGETGDATEYRQDRAQFLKGVEA